MAAGDFSFCIKYDTNILRGCGMGTAVLYLTSWESRIRKETQTPNDTDRLKIIYVHVLLFVQKQVKKYFLVCLQVISLKMTWKKQLLINFNTMSIMLIKF